MPLNDLRAVQHHVPQCLSVAVLDLHEGRILSASPAFDTVASCPTLGAAAFEFFSENLAAPDPAPHRDSCQDDPNTLSPLQDIVVQSAGQFHVFCRSEQDPSRILLCVCKAEAGLGPILAGSRIALQVLQRSM